MADPATPEAQLHHLIREMRKIMLSTQDRRTLSSHEVAEVSATARRALIACGAYPTPPEKAA